MTDDNDAATFEEVGIPERDKPPFLRMPEPASLFANRAARFRTLAPDHKLSAFLIFLADLSGAQDAIARALPSPAMPTEREIRMRGVNNMPVVPREDLAAEPLALDALDRLIARARNIAMPEIAAAALARLETLDEAARRSMLAAVLSDAIPAEEVAEHVFVAAALQIVAALRSARVPEDWPQPVADGVCPCCGGPPVTSAVVGWPNAENNRYVQCSLCASRWNHVRVKCVTCGSTSGIAYQVIDGVADTIKAETCDECRTYTKVLYQNKDNTLDPVADDVASLGLDILVVEAGWRRAAVNPFLLGY
ncbi:formate dehydrogenase accessory protein FdhE [Terrihabitans sp. B22-R8]|uniref:formate dehydrogenase accessory protein FdhE n=1 Tax=Terrihabitans sp. B22-R8 TaxID=3425128 RepID=UPI00403D0CC6